jgi:hypothetical protein
MSVAGSFLPNPKRVEKSERYICDVYVVYACEQLSHKIAWQSHQDIH